MDRCCRWALLVVLLICSSLSQIAESTTCRADETKSINDPNNVYDCPKGALCCFENGFPSCCYAKATSDAVMDQVKLWGGLAGVLFVIVVLVLLCRNDIEICKEGSVCCPCCKHHPQPNDERPFVPTNQRAENMMAHPSFIVPQKPVLSQPYPPPQQQAATRDFTQQPPIHHQNKLIDDDNEFGGF